MGTQCTVLADGGIVMSRPEMSRPEMETRRLEAAAKLAAGARQRDIVRDMGVSRTSASRWQSKLKRAGMEALISRRAGGRPDRLTPDQVREACAMWRIGPQAFGWAHWTGRHFAEAIYRRLGMRFSPDHTNRLIRKWGLRGGNVE